MKLELRDNSKRAKQAILWVGITTLCYPVFFILSYSLGFVSALPRYDISEARINGAVLGGTLMLVSLYIISGIFFLRWYRRCYYNLNLTNEGSFRYSYSWSLWGWIVPIANLFIPYNTMLDMSRILFNERRKKIERRIGIWWAMYIITSITSRIDGESMIYYIIAILFMVVMIIEGILLIKIIKEFSQREIEIYKENS